MWTVRLQAAAIPARRARSATEFLGLCWSLTRTTEPAWKQRASWPETPEWRKERNTAWKRPEEHLSSASVSRALSIEKKFRNGKRTVSVFWDSLFWCFVLRIMVESKRKAPVENDRWEHIHRVRSNDKIPLECGTLTHNYVSMQTSTHTGVVPLG